MGGRRLPAAARLLLLLVILAAGGSEHARAQCCTAGNPVNTNCAIPEEGARLLHVSWSFQRSQSDAYYRGTQRLDKTYAESRYDFSSLALGYSVSDRLRLTADIGYYLDKAQTFVASDYTRYAQGISDATVGISYGAHVSDDGLFSVVQSARVTIPIGDFNQAYDGVVLPIDFQPSSGNYRYGFGLALARRFADSDFSLLSFSSVEFSQAIETENTYHRYGNLYLASILGAYRASDLLQLMLQLRTEIRDRALNGSLVGSSAGRYSYLNSSGGVLWYLTPQVVLTPLADWQIALQYHYPFYKNIYGDEQLTNRHSFAVSLSRVFDFGALFPGGGEEEEFSGLPSFTLRVRGLCEMCKDRIESVAGAQSSVTAARWDAETELLTVSFEDERPDVDAVMGALAAAGHDAGPHRAPDDVYDNLPACCQYR